MIPLRLTLKNFLSYGPAEQTVDFEPYSLMCLSGRNGHGKSAILDAITWAVWGCARKMVGVAKGDDGLVHLGQKEMVVHLEFEADGQRYRIRREFFKSYGKPVTRLDVEVYDAHAEHYVTLTDKSIRATQEKIESVVGVDFSTFVSTSFLRQGQSNEFSKKTPRERKEVIASIIGLATFDQRATCALEKSKEFAQKMVQVQFEADQAARVAGELPGIEAELTAVGEQKHALDERLIIVSRDVDAWGSKAQRLALLKQDFERCVREYSDLADNEATHTRAFAESVARWRSLHRKLRSLSSVDALLSERSRVAHKVEAFNTLEKRASDLAREYDAAHKEEMAVRERLAHANELRKSELFVAKNELLTQQKYLIASLEDVMKRSIELEKQLNNIVQERVHVINQLALRADAEAAYDVGKKLFEKRRSFYHACSSKRTMATALLQEITERRDIVGSVESPACPLCEQLLTQKRKQFLLQQLAKQERRVAHTLARATSVLKMLEDTLRAQRSSLEREAKVCSSFQALEQDLLRFNRDGAHIEQELVRLKMSSETLQGQLKQIERDLLEREKALGACDVMLAQEFLSDERIVRARARMEAVRLEQEQLTYDSVEHQRARDSLSVLDAALHDAKQRSSLFEEGLRLRHAAREQAAQIRNIRREILAKRQIGKHLQDELKDNGDIAGVLAGLEAQRGALLTQKEECARLLGSLAERRQRSLLAADLKASSVRELEALAQEKKEYELLADAYGKNGIQALLIEEILPEVEHEANVLLARLTDNQMQVFIESLRDLKSGGVRETLDIQISDSAGVRPYEMFSGGEAFRIDFALRIAVSKLLARRAGAHLQTLFIDEGFGSQDEEGLSRLTQALFAVQRDFEKIIIVSHLERLKESFPVHIIVEKRAQGSTIHVEERG